MSAIKVRALHNRKDGRTRALASQLRIDVFRGTSYRLATARARSRFRRRASMTIWRGSLPKSEGRNFLARSKTLQAQVPLSICNTARVRVHTNRTVRRVDGPGPETALFARALPIVVCVSF
jgi:hypothetical protein